jgi:hypothetical protein
VPVSQYQERIMSLQTEYDFSLPRGYLDRNGQLHRQGRMRLATARDEIRAAQDPRVENSPAYLPVLLLSQVITGLGGLPSVSPQVVEGMFAADLAYLEDLYLRLNSHQPVLVGAACPHCGTQFQLQVAPLE